MSCRLPKKFTSKERLVFHKISLPWKSSYSLHTPPHSGSLPQPYALLLVERTAKAGPWIWSFHIQNPSRFFVIHPQAVHPWCKLRVFKGCIKQRSARGYSSAFNHIARSTSAVSLSTCLVMSGCYSSCPLYFVVLTQLCSYCSSPCGCHLMHHSVTVHKATHRPLFHC